MRGRSRTVGWVAVASAIGALTFAACQSEGNLAPAYSHGTHGASTISAAQADGIEEVLQVVRRVTQPFADFNVAFGAGYNAQLTGCFENPPVGGMGFHYGNPALIDGVVQALKPEILLYEPQQNGTLLFVGVEYVVPYTAWTKPNPPAIAGVAFHRNDAFGLWVLHAWIGKNNPRGTLFDWNPTVSCQFATSIK
ncbi:MAG: hypothetical protein ACRENH_07655 [Gemmatimonadaceae bacterium]